MAAVIIIFRKYNINWLERRIGAYRWSMNRNTTAFRIKSTKTSVKCDNEYVR